MATIHATKRGDKVTTIEGEGGVLVNGFDACGYAMVEITWSPKKDRLGHAQVYHVGELFDPTDHDVALIPAPSPLL